MKHKETTDSNSANDLEERLRLIGYDVDLVANYTLINFARYSDEVDRV